MIQPPGSHRPLHRLHLTKVPHTRSCVGIGHSQRECSPLHHGDKESSCLHPLSNLIISISSSSFFFIHIINVAAVNLIIIVLPTE